MSTEMQFDEQENTLSSAQQDQLAMMESMSPAPAAAEAEFGSAVKGTVVSITDESVFVNVGMRTDAILAKSEVVDASGTCTVAVGDVLELFVVSSSDSETIVSKSVKGGKNANSRQLLKEMLEKGTPIEGRVSGVNKGGFNVTVMGKRAFCPFSAIDLKYPEDPASYMGRNLDFVISRIERGNNIVLSRLPLLEGDLEVKVAEIEALAASAEPVTGTVSRLTSFGAFVDLGGLEGLVHISELSWDRNEKVEEIVKPGDAISVVVLSVERKEPLRESRISLSAKRLEGDPWDAALAKFSVGSTVEAEVSRIVAFGAFVKLLPGVEALLRTEEMGWSRVRKPSDVVSKGQKISVTILNIDHDGHKIDCSLRDAAQDPWAAIAEKFPVGSQVEGTVADEKPYGYFVDLTEEFTGLLPRKRIGRDAAGSVRKGEKITVTIDTLDTVERRIGLSIGTVEAAEENSNDRAAAQKYMKQQAQQAAAAPGESEFAAMLKKALKK